MSQGRSNKKVRTEPAGPAALGRPAFQAAAVAVLAVLVYLPALEAEFVWDDDDYVTGNETLRDLEGLGRTWTDRKANTQYYPLVYTTFWVEYQLYKLEPLGYHLVNVALHAGVACLLLLLLRRLSVPGAFLAAALFAVHPLCVQSVAWVTERKNVLMGVFYVGSLLAYCRFCGIGGPGDRRDWRFYGLSAGLFALALLSKTVACSMPAVMQVLLWWKRSKVGWRDLWPLAPLFAAGAAMASVTASVEGQFFARSAQGTAGWFAERTLIAGRALWTYVGKIVWPAKLTVFYPQWDIDPSAWWQWLFPVAAVGALVTLWLLRGRLGRGTIAGVVIFAGHLFPALGYFDVYFQRTYSPVADHFAYLSIAALVALLVAAGVRLSRAARVPRPALGVAGVLVAGLGVLTCLQIGMWRNLDAFWQHVIERNPRCWMAYNNYGILLRRRGETDRAADMYRKALAIKPDHAEALNNLGNIRRQEGALAEAVKLYRRAMEIQPNRNTAFNLARVLAKLGSTDDAIVLLEQMVARDEKDFDARLELARLLQASGDEAGALAQYDAILAHQPDRLEVLNSAAWIRATSAHPLLRDGAAAVRLAERAAGRIGSNPALLDTLAAAYAEAGRFAEAVRMAERARDLAARPEQGQLQARIEQRLALYRAGRPFRAAPGR